MLQNQAEIQKVGAHYADKVDKIRRGIELVQRDHDDSTDPTEKASLRTRLDASKNSQLLSFYTNLSKNAASIVGKGNGVFPVIRLVKNTAKRMYEFSSSPKFTREFNQYMGMLGALANADNKAQVQVHDRDKGGFVAKEVTPCFTIREPGEILSDYLSRAEPKDASNYDGINIARLTPNTLDLCPADHCTDCTDCKPHQDELIRSLYGIMSEDPNHGDGLRSLHIKNLITTLDSWAAHMDTRGGTRKTQTMKEYDQDAGNHRVLSTTMRVIAHKLRRAYQEDHVADPNGGGIHKDNVGVGNDGSVY